MSVKENKAIARRYVEAFSDPEMLDEIMAKEIAWPENTQSRDDFKAFWLDILASFPDPQSTILWMVGEGNTVALGWRTKATHTGGKWLDIPPTNKEAEYSVWSYLQIADGKIVALRQEFTALQFWNQLGLCPSWNEIVEQARGKASD
jgi:predicted ester cyclase